MRIGLLRHFPVKHGMPSGWMTAGQLQAWREAYEVSDVEVSPVETGPGLWARCLASDIRRASITAQAAHPGPITYTRLLREVEFGEFRTGRLKLPIWAWHWILRIAWMTSHRSQRAARDAFRERIRAAVDLLESEPTDALVVSHAGVMMFLRKELLKRGFRGPEFRLAENARLYVFERG